MCDTIFSINLSSSETIITLFQEWTACLLVLYSGSIWTPVQSVSVPTNPPKVVPRIEDQAKFFQ